MTMTHYRSAVPLWRRLVLPASLALNLFLVAAIGGHFLRIRQIETSSGTSLVARAVANAEASLSKVDAERFAAVMHRYEPRYMQAAAQREEARAEFERRATAVPFDKEATDQAFRRYEKSSDSLLDVLRTPLIDALADVSPEGRQKLIEQRRPARAAGS